MAMGNWRDYLYVDVFPAMLRLFYADASIDEDGLQTYLAERVAVEGVKAITCISRTDEIMSLRFVERSLVTRLEDLGYKRV